MLISILYLINCQIPEKIEKCIITKDTVLNNAGPKIIENPEKKKKIKAPRVAVEAKETA